MTSPESTPSASKSSASNSSASTSSGLSRGLMTLIAVIIATVTGAGAFWYTQIRPDQETARHGAGSISQPLLSAPANAPANESAQNPFQPSAKGPVRNEGDGKTAATAKRETSDDVADTAQPLGQQQANTGSDDDASQEGTAVQQDSTADANPNANAEGSMSVAPSFDVFRVEPDGNVVAAGRAAPGATVDLMVNGQSVGSATADRAGEWALVPKAPLPIGDHDIQLTARGTGGIGGGPSKSALSVAIDGKNTPLVALIEPGKPANVLQTPETTIAQAEAARGEPAQTKATQAGIDQNETGDRDTRMSDGQTSKLDAPKSEASKPDSTRQDALPKSEAGAQMAAATEDGAQAAAPAAASRTENDAGASMPATTSDAPAPGGGSQSAAIGTPVIIAGVEIENEQTLHIQGSGPAGRRLRLYVNDAAVADVRTDEAGRFAETIERSLAPGRYTVRADLLKDDGQVEKRAEVRFDRLRLADANAPADTAGNAMAENQPIAGQSSAAQAPISAPASADAGTAAATVEKTVPGAPQSIPDVAIVRGDNLWQIARRIYGAGVRYSVIYEANKGQIRDPNLIYPGQVFTVPIDEDAGAE